MSSSLIWPQCAANYMLSSWFQIPLHKYSDICCFHCRVTGEGQLGDQAAGYSDEEDADIDVGIGEASDSSDEETEPEVCVLSMHNDYACLQQQIALLCRLR